MIICCLLIRFNSIEGKKKKSLGLNLIDRQVSITSHSSEFEGGRASLTSSTFNLAKSIIGAGVLSLPSGIAYFSDSPAAIFPANFLWCVSYIADSPASTQSYDYYIVL